MIKQAKCWRIKFPANERGMILPQICIAFVVATMMLTAFYNQFSSVYKTWEKLQAEHSLNSGAIYTMNFIEKQLYLNSKSVSISKSGTSVKLICTGVQGNEKVTFYKNGNKLQRKIEKGGGSEGINVISHEEVIVKTFETQAVDARNIVITLNLQDKNGNEKIYTEVCRLLNGKVSGAKE